MPEHAHEQQLKALRQQYLDKLPKQLHEIQSAWEHLQHVNWDIKKLDTLKQACHRLAGSGGSYGFAEISQHAREVDEKLSGIQAQANPTQRKEINRLIAKLALAIENANQSSEQPVPDIRLSTKKTGKTIAIIEDDPAQADLLKMMLTAQGHQAKTFNCPNTFASDQDKTHYDLIFLDLSFPEGPLEGLFWLEHIHHQLKTHCPIIITSARSDFVARMRALRAGASAYITKPYDMDEVNTQIERCLKDIKSLGARVLWVDDDEQLLALYREILGYQGFQFKGLSQPVKILETLDHFVPDIIIMDYQMPGCTGAELAHMLKQDSRFMTIPIIFASGSPSANDHKVELGILGNAFIQKPIDNSELLATIKNQLSKARYLSQKISQVSQRLDQDGLQTRHYFLQSLDHLLQQKDLTAKQEHCFLIYLSVENLDYLKEQFGLRNLSQLSMQLEHFLASHPFIQGNGCTLNPNTYLLLATFKPADDAREELKQFLELLQNKIWQVDGKSCSMNLAMGVTRLQANAKLDDLISRLETACYAGMKAGNQKLQMVEEAGQDNTQLDDTLRALLEAKSFKLLFQPIVNLETDDTLFESLIRLEDEQGRLYAPAHFLPWLEDTLEGGSMTLDRWLIDQATAITSGPQRPSLIIKLASPLSKVISLLPELRFSGGHQAQTKKHLYLSLPLSVVIKNVEKARQVIESFTELGCGIILEKVEPQESHLKLLRDLGQLDCIKINSAGTHSEALDKFIKIVKTLPHAPTVIIAGVEDSLMLSHYWEQGVRNFQGYFIQHPGGDLMLKENES